MRKSNQNCSTSPKFIIQSIFNHHELIWRMIKQEIISRYRGSVFGLFWSFVNPLVMLLVYLFVFNIVLKTRFNENSETKAEYALLVFAGFTVFIFFSEIINRSPSLILSNVNFVKKLVFPLEILTYIVTGTALFQILVNIIILLIANLLIYKSLPWTLVFFPVILLVLIPFCLGFSWMLASLGTFIRDVGPVAVVSTQILMFMTPIFYPVDAIPEGFRYYIKLNPLTLIVSEMRSIAIYGNLPNWYSLLIYGICGWLIAWIGFFWFQKTRNGFSNVL